MYIPLSICLSKKLSLEHVCVLWMLCVFDSLYRWVLEHIQLVKISLVYTFIYCVVVFHLRWSYVMCERMMVHVEEICKGEIDECLFRE